MISDSPAMSAFIKEIFLKNDKAPFNFGNIQKEISEYNEDPSSNTTKPDNLLAKQHEKRQWISLQHYKEISKKSYSFIRDEDVNLKVAALRSISFLINRKLLEVAKFLAPKIVSNKLNSCNDPLADIVAISAILYKCNKAIPIVRKHIVINKIFLK